MEECRRKIFAFEQIFVTVTLGVMATGWCFSKSMQLKEIIVVWRVVIFKVEGICSWLLLLMGSKQMENSLAFEFDEGDITIGVTARGGGDIVAPPPLRCSLPEKIYYKQKCKI